MSSVPSIPRDLTQTAICIIIEVYCGLQDYSEFQLTLIIVLDYDGTSTQMECSDVNQ